MTDTFRKINRIIDRLEERAKLMEVARNFSYTEQEFVGEEEIQIPTQCLGKYDCTSEFGGTCSPNKDHNYHCTDGHTCPSAYSCGAFTCKPKNISKESAYDCKNDAFTCMGYKYQCQPNFHCTTSKGFSCTNNVLCNGSNVSGEFECQTSQGFVCGHPGSEPDAFFCQGRFACESKSPPFTCERTTSFECRNQREGENFECAQASGNNFSCKSNVTCRQEHMYDCTQSGQAHNCEQKSVPSFNCQTQQQYNPCAGKDKYQCSSVGNNYGG